MSKLRFKPDTANWLSVMAALMLVPTAPLALGLGACSRSEEFKHTLQSMHARLTIHLMRQAGE